MTQNIYNFPDTAVTFTAGGTVAFNPTSVANGAGRVSTQYDRGTGARPNMFRYMMTTRVGSNPSVNNQLRPYIVPADATFVTGRLGTTDAAVSSEDSFRNCIPLLPIDIDGTTSTLDFIRLGSVWIPSRYFSVGWWNATGQTLSATTSHHICIFEPIPEQLQ